MSAEVYVSVSLLYFTFIFVTLLYDIVVDASVITPCIMYPRSALIDYVTAPADLISKNAKFNRYVVKNVIGVPFRDIARLKFLSTINTRVYYDDDYVV